MTRNIYLATAGTYIYGMFAKQSCKGCKGCMHGSVGKRLHGTRHLVCYTARHNGVSISTPSLHRVKSDKARILNTEG